MSNIIKINHETSLLYEREVQQHQKDHVTSKFVKFFSTLLFNLLILLFFCEFFIYYVVIYQVGKYSQLYQIMKNVYF